MSEVSKSDLVNMSSHETRYEEQTWGKHKEVMHHTSVSAATKKAVDNNSWEER
jgi:hypothetical protein